MRRGMRRVKHGLAVIVEQFIRRRIKCANSIKFRIAGYCVRRRQVSHLAQTICNFLPRQQSEIELCTGRVKTDGAVTRTMTGVNYFGVRCAKSAAKQRRLFRCDDRVKPVQIFGMGTQKRHFFYRRKTAQQPVGKPHGSESDSCTNLAWCPANLGA